jgi:hypothetical protein
MTIPSVVWQTCLTEETPGATIETVNMNIASSVTMSNGWRGWLMAIPPLLNGLLPPGIYTASLTEVWAVFDQASSATRKALNQALEHTVAVVWSRDPTAAIYVNGSYATDKIDPVDVDLAVRSDVWDDTTFTAEYSQTYPGEGLLVDIFFNTTQSSQHMEDLFQEVQGSSVHKGIILLIP